MEVPVQQPQRVAGPRGHLAELAGEGEAFDDRVRGDDDGNAAVERVRERGGVFRAAGELDRLLAQRVAAIARGFVAQRRGETGEQDDPKLDVLLGERIQSLLEQRHEPIVASGPEIRVLARVARRGAGKLSRQAESSRDAGRVEESALRGPDVPRTRLRSAG